MGKRFSVQEATRLYLIILGFFLGFYLVGLILGGSYLEMGRAQTAGSADMGPQEGEVEEGAPEVLAETTDLGFYDELKDGDAEETEAEGRNAPAHEAETPAPAVQDLTEESPRNQAQSEEQFTVQVAALDTREEAEEFLLRLESRDFDGRITEPSGFGDQYYRVWVGTFGTREAASALEADLKEAGFLTYVREID